MKRWIVASMVVGGLMGMGKAPNLYAQQSNSFTGTVERVWEDGFLFCKPEGMM